ncbi:hypothetical protein VHN57_01965 [Sphingobium sp. WW5]|uniref:Mom family adenine methylcarbamoylation protein n=1 Tax=unclassified Sphingobium TaxID=2611147 RepID=UPI003C25EB4D
MTISAKDIRLMPIASRDANAMVAKLHYSGKWVRNSQLHLGAFVGADCLGVMSFGPSMDKSKVLPLVAGTAWYDMLELNRMAFSDALPRNSESRCLAMARKLIFRQYPNIEWLLTFADGTQCGDGTIYRASGWELSGIRPNRTIYEFPTVGRRYAAMTLEAHWSGETVRQLCRDLGVPHEYRTRTTWCKMGLARPLPGFQLRYMTFRDRSVRDRLTVPILPNSAIDDAAARMVRGEAK